MNSRQETSGGSSATLEWIRAQPKAELHLHLLGAIRPRTALELAERHRVGFPLRSEREWVPFFSAGDLSAFVTAFTALFDLLRTKEDFERVAREVFQDLAADGIAYAEPRITLTSHLSRGVALGALVEGLSAARVFARAEWNLEIGWIVDFPRVLGREVGERALQEAMAGREWGVVGFDIAGYEGSFGDESYLVDLFRRARESGLGTTAHAGEIGSSARVRTAVEDWKVDRIGHGIQAAGDTEVMRLLAENRIPLEIAPTSNLLLGVVDSLESHPIEILRRAGVPVTVNTDDPSLFGTTLSRELRSVAETFRWSWEVVEEVISNAWEFRFARPGLNSR